jgi:hypothetical protein
MGPAEEELVIDPFGPILRILRADAATLAIVGTDDTRISGNLPKQFPCVQLIDSATTRRPFGVGSAGLGLQLWTGYARCYGAKDTPRASAQSGSNVALARQLAGAASDALHQRNGQSGSAFIVRAYAPDIEGVQFDPDLRIPFYDVRIEAYLGASAVEAVPVGS